MKRFLLRTIVVCSVLFGTASSVLAEESLCEQVYGECMSNPNNDAGECAQLLGDCDMLLPSEPESSEPAGETGN